MKVPATALLTERNFIVRAHPYPDLILAVPRDVVIDDKTGGYTLYRFLDARGKFLFGAHVNLEPPLHPSEWRGAIADPSSLNLDSRHRIRVGDWFGDFQQDERQYSVRLFSNQGVLWLVASDEHFTREMVDRMDEFVAYVAGNARLAR